MVTKGTVKRVSDFSGGLNLKVSDEEASSSEARVMKNFEIGAGTPDLVKRRGNALYEVAITGSQPVAGLYRFYKSTGSKYTVAISGTSIWAIQDGDGAWTEIGSAGIVTASDKFWSFVTWPLTDVVYFVNEEQPGAPNKMFKWDGTMSTGSVTTVTTPERFKFIIMHQEKMFALSVDDQSRVWFSAPQDPENWQNEQNIDNFIGTDSNWGDRSVGLSISANGSLIIYKEASRHVLSGYSAQTYRLYRMSTNTGTVAPGSIYALENDIMDLTPKGLYKYLSGTSVNYASEKIEPIFRDQVNGNLLFRAVAGYAGYKYYIALPKSGSTELDFIVIYDVLRNCFYTWESSLYQIRSMSVWNNEGNAGEIYFGDNLGRVFKMNEGNSDNGVDIECEYKSVLLHMGELERRKRFRAFWIGFSGNEGLLYNYWEVDKKERVGQLPDTDMTSVATKWNQSYWGQGKWNAAIPLQRSWGFDDSAVGQGIQMVLKEKSQLGTFSVKYYSILYKRKTLHYEVNP